MMGGGIHSFMGSSGEAATGLQRVRRALLLLQARAPPKLCAAVVVRALLGVERGMDGPTRMSVRYEVTAAASTQRCLGRPSGLHAAAEQGGG